MFLDYEGLWYSTQEWKCVKIKLNAKRQKRFYKQLIQTDLIIYIAHNLMLSALRKVTK